LKATLEMPLFAFVADKGLRATALRWSDNAH
jgi:hypothetical protein